MKMATGGKCKICNHYFTNMSLCRSKKDTVIDSDRMKDMSGGMSIDEIDLSETNGNYDEDGKS